VKMSRHLCFKNLLDDPFHENPKKVWGVRQDGLCC
jgi:hypothetical protein